MKKNVVFFVLLAFAISTFGYAYSIEKVDLGGGKSLNYVLSTDYEELESFVAREFGVRINIGQTNSWDDNTRNDALAPQIRNLLRQYTQQGKYNSFAMAIFTTGDDIDEILVNWCYLDKGVYIYKTTYWRF
jgi:hypothetical protein